MLPSIKQYKLKPNITREDLLKAGFSEFKAGIILNKPVACYSTTIIDEIELYIEIEIDTMKFDCYDNVLILDADFCQPYTPFYGDSEFNYLNKVIEKYNIKMDNLVSKGVLELA